MVEFGATVDPAINDRVISLDEWLAQAPVPGVLETVPTYRSLMIHYNPLVVDRENLVAKIDTLIGALQLRLDAPRIPKNSWLIPCCYEPPFAEDLNEIAAAIHLPPPKVAALHCETALRAYMYGFAPGCCYLGGLPRELAISRRPAPRAPHAANAVLVAGGLSLISTFSMPTGWWVIGRTPVRLFSPLRNPQFLIEVGDLVRFTPIGAREYRSMEERAIAGDVVAVRETPR